ncbi:uncharacterized protein FFC1_15919 [Fusarium fujikuroi]|nr:uncharacterized protein FFC1_15919 [Fusarium fujikuroi]
MLKKSVLF